MFEIETECRVCRSERLLPVLDLGSQPPANSLRSDPGEQLEVVPLELVFCADCRTSQLTATVDPAELFRDYVWVTGTARTTRQYSEVFRDRVLGIVGRTDDRMVVEVASNDGTFLARFQDAGCRVLGVDPAANIVEVANEAGVPTRCDFFDLRVAEEVRAEHGPADVVIARNVIPHVREVHSIIEGMAHLLDDGTAVIEFHTASQIVRELHYDSIYHEHLFYFSLSTLASLCGRYGLRAFEVFDSPISGGSRVLVLARTDRPVSAALVEGLAEEEAAGLNGHLAWEAFSRASRRHALELRDVVRDCSRRSRIVGYGASARSSTMLNYAGITTDDVAVVIDENPYKQGRYTPGTDLPIVSRPEGLDLLGRDGTVLLLAWNFADEILGDLRRDGIANDVIIPLPGSVHMA